VAWAGEIEHDSPGIAIEASNKISGEYHSSTALDADNISRTRYDKINELILLILSLQMKKSDHGHDPKSTPQNHYF
jgi:hypothetical protein